MSGSLTPGVQFTDLVRDTVQTHGIAWAVRYYYARMPAWEARFWLRRSLAA